MTDNHENYCLANGVTISHPQNCATIGGGGEAIHLKIIYKSY